jgi:hypothetical protein
MHSPSPRVVTYTEGNTRSSVMVRMGRTGGVLKPWHAWRDALKNLGDPFESKNPVESKNLPLATVNRHSDWMHGRRSNRISGRKPKL